MDTIGRDLFGQKPAYEEYTPDSLWKRDELKRE